MFHMSMAVNFIQRLYLLHTYREFVNLSIVTIKKGTRKFTQTSIIGREWKSPKKSTKNPSYNILLN